MTKRQSFPLFQTPLDLAHAYWKRLLKPGDFAIDATCGNGHDTLFLTSIVSNDNKWGSVVGLDNQQQAIESTRHLLCSRLSEELLKSVSLYTQCHSSFPAHIAAESVTLLVYNLGYLPKGDKNLTTLESSTKQSLKAALPLIARGGAISITCYPGHEAGKPEEEMVLNFAASLDPQEWSSCCHRWMNRRNAPSLIFIQRAILNSMLDKN